MKRTAIIVALVALCLVAVGYRPVRVVWEKHRHEQVRRSLLVGSTPFVLDPVTQGILSHADRVETFRLSDIHEARDRTTAEWTALSGPHPVFGEHPVLHKGQPQGPVFAAAMQTALTQTRSPTFLPGCFDPGVGYRVWKGKAHTDLCVCFYCEGIELVTQDAHHKEVTKTMISLGAARPAFLALSQQAFPQDKELAALKTS